jgi:hypothetical protein
VIEIGPDKDFTTIMQAVERRTGVTLRPRRGR